MPSVALLRWSADRNDELDELEAAHTSVGGTGPGRRYATQQINRAYAVLLAAHFQGFCRDLHTECVEHLLRVIAPPAALRILVSSEFIRGRQLDRGNAQSSSLGADFGRLVLDFWDKIKTYDTTSVRW